MGHVISIALGGALGALLRFGVSNAAYALLGRGFPYGTLLVNVVGSFLIGVFAYYFMQKGMMDTPLARGLLIGVLGAFTTFSTFSLDTLLLIENAEWGKAMLNVLLNVLLCVGAAWLGMLTMRLL